MGVDCNELLSELDTAISSLPKVGAGAQVYLSPEADRALNAAEKAAGSMGDEYISVEHLMIGLFAASTAAIKRIFADPAINADAAAHGITLSSANSINTGRLVPQIAYYVLAGAKLAGKDGKAFDVVVPSGNFGNILAAYYAKLLGSPIRKLVVASNVNDVLARFVKSVTT